MFQVTVSAFACAQFVTDVQIDYYVFATYWVFLPESLTTAQVLDI